ncbi:ribulose-phosphate 3-epimerase [Mycoplasmopsis cricetuli]|uniref:ribulose-phosphate 3-epimerase n=1 Tax=Mycoplasmopsis cricetuli TaxID=171283 RepID=UPI00047221D2|nr:ribulose-phosphate 3-epimerase [Mycoplasmopsis cricetuli]
MKKYITPSLLNVSSEQRPQLVNDLIKKGISWFHYDIMDGEFVSNLAIEPSEIKNIDQNCKKHFKDAHLMVKDPYLYTTIISDYVDIVTFHYEAIENDLEKFFNFLIDSQDNLKIGLAIRPETSVKSIEHFLQYLSLVLVMSVNPGHGGQKFIPTAIEKLTYLKNLRTKNGYQYLIQVDGGINNITGPQAFKAGADACVVGTYLVFEPTQEKINSILGKKK